MKPYSSALSRIALKSGAVSYVVNVASGYRAERSAMAAVRVETKSSMVAMNLAPVSAPKLRM